MAERVYWSEDEWDTLAKSVFTMRMKDPLSPLSTLANKAISGFPQARKRKLVSNDQLKPLVDRLQELYQQLRQRAEVADKLEKRLEEVRTAEEILESLTDSEIIRLYGERFLATMTPEELLSQLTPQQILESFKTETLVAEASRRFVEDLLNNPVIRQISIAGKPPVSPTVSPTKQRLPKVVLVGLKAAQQQVVRDALNPIADLRFVDKNRSASDVPQHADVYVVWSRFTSHDMTATCKKYAPPGCYIQHVGGVEKLIESVQLLLVERFYNGRT